MGSVTKRNHPLALAFAQTGQISIFFSASIVVLISIIAFVINVGLFVKAKINLQNATDAAAFSGAAVQARQLTKLAHLNWEMRNIFKEWMYKYYVIGNLNIDDVRNPAGTGNMSFRLLSDTSPLRSERYEDPYNLPAVCIHVAGNDTNICRRFAMPGLPEFGGFSLAGTEEAARSFQDVLINTKVDDCVQRSRLNMLTATAWAFNVASNAGAPTLASQGLAVVTDRQGAWPQAVELGIRMRNMEYVVNRPPETTGVCANNPSHPDIRCARRIDEVSGENRLGNERIVKAFYAGYRNLGNERDAEMKNSFTLTEIPPARTPVSREGLGGENSASYLLIPKNNVGASYHKQYLDLKLMTVNYATFYAMLIPRGGDSESGKCDISKVAIPVPGYPLGFYKNPDVVTYYAVKGEAEFVGMFNPFSSDSIRLTAYAAAKPFGGRIGPMLFTQRNGDSFFTGRTDPAKYRSVPYFSSLELTGTPHRVINGRELTPLSLGDFRPGVPLPINFDRDPGYFWLREDGLPLGGSVSGRDVQFGIPNLVYDYVTPFRIDGYQDRDTPIHRVLPATGNSGRDGDKAIGLFSKQQFSLFKGTLPSSIGPDEIVNAIYRARAPTSYEAANYLIPIPAEEYTGLSPILDSFGFVPGPARDLPGVKVYTTRVYAPLYKVNDQTDMLFQTRDDVKNAFFDLMRAQEQGMAKYMASLNLAAKSLYDVILNEAAIGTRENNRRAAAKISDPESLVNPSVGLADRPQTCSSMSGQFLWFYYGHPDLRNGLEPADETNCPVTLGSQLESYFSATVSGASFDPEYYTMELSWKDGSPVGLPFSAYRPGPITGVGRDGIFDNVISGSGIRETMHRNFYSTKFIPLQSVRGGGQEGFNEEASNFSIYSEGPIPRRERDTRQSSLKNSLDAQSIGLDLNTIKH